MLTEAGLVDSDTSHYHVNQFTGNTSPPAWTDIWCIILQCHRLYRILRGRMHANVSVVRKVYCDDRTKLRDILTICTASSIMSSKIRVFCTHSSVYLPLFQLSG